MLTLLINKFKKVLILLIAAAMVLATTVSHADDYIKYRVIENNYSIKQASNVTAPRQCEVVIRVGEYQGKAGKRIYINSQTVRIPDDIPIRNDHDGKGFYISEWDINMKEAKALVKELRARGVNATLQTSYNRSTDLNAAGKIANKSNPYLYISLHHNYYASDSKGYFAVYNPGDKLGEHVANRLSNSIKYNGKVPQNCNQHNTGYIGELNEINPSITPVLMELGFFSNPEELEIICSDKYVEYVSTNLSNEIVKILNTEYR